MKSKEQEIEGQNSPKPKRIIDSFVEIKLPESLLGQIEEYLKENKDESATQ